MHDRISLGRTRIKSTYPGGIKSEQVLENWFIGRSYGLDLFVGFDECLSNKMVGKQKILCILKFT